MHQSIPAAPIPPPGNCGAFARIVSPGGRALAYPRATPGLLTHVVSDSKSKRRRFYRKRPVVCHWLACLSRTGPNCGGFKGMFPRFQAFSHCLSSYNTETWPRKIVVIMYFAFKTYPGGGAFALFFHPHPREFATQNEKSANARGLARGGDGRSWNWLMH